MSRNNGMLMILGVALLLLVGGGVAVFGGLMGDPGEDPSLDSGWETTEKEPDPLPQRPKNDGPVDQITPRKFEAKDEQAGVAAPASKRSTGISLSGVVRGPNGGGLGAASVELYRDVSAVRTRPQQGEVVARMITPASGQFRIDDLLGDERYVLRVRHDDYAATTRHPIEPRDQKTLFQEVRLESGLGFMGVVYDANKAPLEGAKVYVYDEAVQSLDPADTVERIVKTDADGKYAFKNLAQGVKKVVARKSGFSSDGRASLQLLPKKEVGAIDFVLNQGFMIKGKVTDKNSGQPVAGAVITARPLSALSRHRPRPGQLGEDEREEQIRNVEEFRRALKEGGKPAAERIRRERVNATARAKAFRPRGTDFARKAFLLETATTDENGEFVLEGLLEANYRLMARCRGFQNHHGIQASAGDDNLNLALTPSARISGVVVDASTGTPIPWFNIAASPSADLSFLPVQTRQRFSDKDGKFSFLDVRPGKTYLYAEADDHAIGRSEILTVEAGQSLDGVVIRLPLGATLRGRVVSGEGVPVRGAKVKLQDSKSMATGPAAMFIGLIQNQIRGSSQVAFTDEKGIWEIEHVSPGVYKASATHKDFTEGSSTEVSCKEDGEVAVPDITLRPGGIIRGVVRGKDGSPEVGAVIMVSSTDAQSNFFNRSVQSNGRGEFEVTGLRSGSYRVFVTQRAGTFDLMAVLQAQQNQNIVHVTEGKVSEVEL